MEKNKEYYEALDKRTNEFKDWKKSQSIEPNETVDTTDKWEGIANEVTQANLQSKHEANPTIETTIGAGDVVEKITTVTGIKAIVKAFTPEGEDCGCDKRKEKLNELVQIKNKKKVECLNVDEYEFLSHILSNNRQINGANSKRIVEIYARIFNEKKKDGCVSCSFSAAKLNELKAVLETYK
jgi:PHD/YefM family antitoxin component YafN of YafNO toxin-antitoxin module